MSRVLIFISIFLIFSCGEKNEKSKHKKSTQIDSIEQKEKSDLNKKSSSEKTDNSNQEIKINFDNGKSRERIKLKKSTVVIVKMDSLEIEQIKKNDKEDNFYTASDDLMWYNSMMMKKMDSLKIDVKYTNKDTVDIQTADLDKTIIKDTTFSLYTYFYFDGEKIKRVDLMKLLSE